MIQSGHLNPSEETGTGCPVTSKYGRTPPNKHVGVGRQQQQNKEERKNMWQPNIDLHLNQIIWDESGSAYMQIKIRYFNARYEIKMRQGIDNNNQFFINMNK